MINSSLPLMSWFSGVSMLAGDEAAYEPGAQLTNLPSLNCWMGASSYVPNVVPTQRDSATRYAIVLNTVLLEHKIIIVECILDYLLTSRGKYTR